MNPKFEAFRRVFASLGIFLGGLVAFAALFVREASIALVLISLGLVIAAQWVAEVFRIYWQTRRTNFEYGPRLKGILIAIDSTFLIGLLLLTAYNLFLSTVDMLAIVTELVVLCAYLFARTRMSVRRIFGP